jgi:hypothetical protein
MPFGLAKVISIEWIEQSTYHPGMSEVIPFAAGGYRYIKSVFQYSAGAAAEQGFEIRRARLARPLPLAEGFRAVEKHLAALGRPTTAFCACELRSPEPFSEQGFIDFNRGYVQTLERWGLYKNGVNPVARTNVCPKYGAPSAPALYAFSYTVPGAGRGFIISGGGEAAEGKGSYRERIVRYGDTSPEGLREKIRFVVAAMERRLAALGFGWSDAASTQAYSVQDIGALADAEIVARGAAVNGLTWHFCRPPVVGIDFEMDVRGAARELVLPV